MTAAEPPTVPPPPGRPAAAAPQTTRSSGPACATSKVCMPPNPACPAHFQCLAETAGCATATTPPPASRWPQLQSPPATPPRSSATPRVLRGHTPPAHTATLHPPATAEAANTRETCSTPGSSTKQKTSTPLPPKSSTAAACAPQSRRADARHSAPPPNPHVGRATRLLQS